jgi:hypothetical protein
MFQRDERSEINCLDSRILELTLENKPGMRWINVKRDDYYEFKAVERVE